MELITLTDLAEELGIHRSYLRKCVLAMGIQPEKVRTEASRNQLTLAVSREEAEDIRAARSGFTGPGPDNLAVGSDGDFYMLVIDPEVRPGRIKLGFAQSLEQRTRNHYTIAPKLEVAAVWRCKRSWEKTVIAAVGCMPGASHVGGEVYDFEDVEAAIERADTVLRMLPGYWRRG